MSSISPIEFVFFLSIALIPTGPYVYVETIWKKTGIATTVVGVIGTVAVGIAVFSHALPAAFFVPKIPGLIAFLSVALGFAFAVAIVILQDRRASAVVAVRDVALLCLAMWLLVRFVGPWLRGESIGAMSQEHNRVLLGYSGNQPVYGELGKPAAEPKTAKTPASALLLYRYRNELSVRSVIGLVNRLNGIFAQNQPLVFVITAPPESEAFKDDFYGIVVAGAQGRQAVSATIEPAPDPRIAVDTGIPEPKYPGIVVHAPDSMPKLTATMLTNTLGQCFIVHKSEQVPDAIKKLIPKDFATSTTVWFEVGNGSPWSNPSCSFP